MNENDNKNKVEELKISAGAMAELLRIFYESLIQNKFTPLQALAMTSDYMKAVFGK